MATTLFKTASDDLKPFITQTRATVKWFNETKGFGFVTIDGDDDAFLHKNLLTLLGNVTEKSVIICDVAESNKGLQVTKVHSIESVGEVKPAIDTINGIVKFYSTEKGFGFVSITETRDAFISSKTLDKCGIKTLIKGQKVVISITKGEKGDNVSKIKLV